MDVKTNQEITTHQKMQFNQNGENITIRVGDRTDQDFVVAGIYDDPDTNERQIVITPPKPLSDCATRSDGQVLIDVFNEEHKESLGEFKYPDGAHKRINVLNILKENKNVFDGLEPTENNPHAIVHGAIYEAGHADNQSFKKGSGIHWYNFKNTKGFIVPVLIINETDIKDKVISFQPR
jgi:hypothetical protein